ncbi:NepR family anti-sigma factor [Bartonella sp. C271]|uniref:NepR family anti-sigma factor n=1 Tax=Bartonella sp. C271 TaxID=3070220 RepID=UPI0038B489B7
MNNFGEKNLTDYFTFEDDLLGANSEIALKLRQFYMQIQEEPLPLHLLELLDKLEQAEKDSLHSEEKRFDLL